MYQLLLVDDDPALLRSMERALVLHGCEVIAFTDPLTARDAFGAGPARFDAVVLDQSMPGLSGVQLAAWIRERSPALPVLLLTGDARELGALPEDVVALEKPIPIAALLERVRSLVVRARLDRRVPRSG